jgi:DNA-binding protein H-NS
MNAIDLKGLSPKDRKELLSELKELDKQDFVDRCKMAKAKCAKLCQNFGVTLQQAFFEGKNAEGHKYPVLYRNSQTGDTWTGQGGNAPTWLVDEADEIGEKHEGWQRKDWIAFAEQHFKIKNTPRATDVPKANEHWAIVQPKAEKPKGPKHVGGGEMDLEPEEVGEVGAQH